MELHTARLLLREFRLEDFATTHAYAADVETTRHTLFGPNTEQDTRDFLVRMAAAQAESPRATYDLAVTLRESGVHIGTAGLRVRGPLGDVGYVFHKDHWSKGYATEAARALLEFGFRELKLHRVIATCDIANPASARVMEKLGMRREGHLRKNSLMKGTWRDSWLYAILEEERPA